MDEVGNDESCRTESGVATGNGRCHYSQQGQNTSGNAQPLVTHLINNRGRVANGCGTSCYLFITRRRLVVEEIHGHRSPNQSHDTFSNHSTIEDRTAHLLARDAACHQRTLRSVETADGATGNGDEQCGENAGRRQGLYRQAFPNLGQVRHLHKQHHHQRCCHKEQREGKERIYLADNLVDRQHRGNDIVNEDDQRPPHILHLHHALLGCHCVGACHIAQNLGGTVDEHHAHHDEQEDREHQHDTLGGITQIVTYNLRLVGTAMTHREHSAKIVVHSTCKDASKYYPQVGGRTELGTHNSTEDRTRAGNIEELNHKHLPVGKGYVV